MRAAPAALVPLLALLACGAGQSPLASQPAPSGDLFDLSHAALDAILRARVHAGQVDYSGLAEDREALDGYLAEAVAVPRGTFETWSESDRLAFLINAYNARTLQLVIDHWPVDSIRDTDALGNPWDHFTFPLLGEEVTLNGIEHRMIRPVFHEPRVHFALVCAAVSCPPLRPRAWVGETLDADLEEATRAFLADPASNDLSDPAHPRLSALFDWYGDDFAGAAGSVAAFISEHSGLSIPDNAEIDFLDYDWNINSQ
ncbi:DUF547 domain-containing protein [Candidatus Sumerlaeota bacterium]|nr:DUF547 domain-containing protein [Candidatus Sumerlaeota bacterium]